MTQSPWPLCILQLVPLDTPQKRKGLHKRRLWKAWRPKGGIPKSLCLWLHLVLPRTPQKRTLRQGQEEKAQKWRQRLVSHKQSLMRRSVVPEVLTLMLWRLLEHKPQKRNLKQKQEEKGLWRPGQVKHGRSLMRRSPMPEALRLLLWRLLGRKRSRQSLLPLLLLQKPA